METLLPSTFEDLKVLCSFTEELYDTYSQLKELEINHMQDTSQFISLVERVKQLLNITNTIESRISTDINELRKVIEYLDTQLGLPYNPDNTKYIKTFGVPKEKMLLIRIVNNLSKQLDSHFIKSNSGKTTKYRRCYSFLINNNIDIMTLAKLRREGLFDDATLKKSIYDLKYEMIFSNNSIEKDLLDQNFHIDENPYIIKDSLKSMFNIDDDTALECESKVLTPLIAGNLMLLCNSDDSLCENIAITARSTVFTYGILAALILADNPVLINGALDTIKDVTIKIADSPSFIIVKNLLEVILEDYETDKEQYKFISFGGSAPWR